METSFQSFARNLPSSVINRIMAPSDGENRLVTVLFTDMSASVATTARLDPEAAAELVNGLLRAMVDVFSRYEGRIDRFLGDGALAVFGTPHAHEDDPERAILSALEIRGRAQERGLNVTSGINTGQVYFGLMGPDEHHELTVMGPVVNLAARLQSKARAGEIIIGDSTWQHVRRSFDLGELALDIKGIEGSVRAYRVDGRRARLEKVRGLEGLRAQLVGREKELATLVDAYDEVMRGTGRMVSIIGEAGVGKSRLVAELKAHALGGTEEGRRPHWFEGRCIELGVTAAYWPFIDMLGQHFGLAEQPGAGGRGAHAAKALDELQASGGLSAERAQEIGPFLGRLLSIRFGNEWDLALAHAQPEQIKHQTFLAVRDLLLAFARQRPLVAVLDDLHWADSLSIDVIALLMESLTIAPILLVCMYRPERDQRCWQLATIASRKCPERFAEISLRELTPSQSRHLIQSLLSVEALPKPMRESILTQSQGNPFFVEEVIRSLIDSGVVYRVGDQWQAREDAADTKVPESLQSVILSRVDRLEADLKYLLESASVIGRIFRRRVLESAQEEQREIEDALGRLEERALIYAESTVPEEEYSFKHVLTQQAVYQSILRRRRGRLHGRIAQAIESLYQESLDEYCEQLAYHHEQAGSVEKAVEHLLKAGMKAKNAFLNDTAIRHFEHALELLEKAKSPPGRHRLQALVELGRIFETIGKHSQAESAFRDAEDLARGIGSSPRELVSIRNSLCRAISTRHRPRDYVPITRESLALLGSDTDCAEAVWAEMMMAHEAFERGDPSRTCEVAARRKAIIRASPYSAELADDSALFIMVNFLAKNEPEAMDWLEWVEGQAREHNDLLSLAATHVRRGRDMHAQRGDLPHAMEAIDQAIELYRRIGSLYRECRAHLYAGDIFYRFGRLDAADASQRRAQSISEEIPQHVHLQSECEMLKGQLALSRGNTEEALAAFRSALEKLPGDQWQWFLQHLIGCALLDQGRKKEAARSFMTILGATLAFRLPPAYSLTIDLAHVLSLLETCDDEGKEFHAACALVQRKRPESRELLSQWFLEPAVPKAFPRSVAREDLRSQPSPEWQWIDPYGDSGRDIEAGLLISAGPGRGLWGSNLSAPRLMRPAAGDCAHQVSCGPAESGMPGVGGVLLWKSERDYLRLDFGSFAARDVAFCGCIGNKDTIIGRGRVPAERVRLRLERSGATVRALCSADGKAWFTVGEVDFPAGGPLEVGLFADGVLRPELYPRTYVAGSRIRFTDFELSAAT
jgi:class 3 adenylate cyclase/tetratricopeptide (TPR) repeat protein